jgi:hypothetical protein
MLGRLRTEKAAAVLTIATEKMPSSAFGLTAAHVRRRGQALPGASV